MGSISIIVLNGLSELNDWKENLGVQDVRQTSPIEVPVPAKSIYQDLFYPSASLLISTLFSLSFFRPTSTFPDIFPHDGEIRTIVLFVGEQAHKEKSHLCCSVLFIPHTLATIKLSPIKLCQGESASHKREFPNFLIRYYLTPYTSRDIYQTTFCLYPSQPPSIMSQDSHEKKMAHVDGEKTRIIDADALKLAEMGYTQDMQRNFSVWSVLGVGFSLTSTQTPSS